jgi:hypothetical protein
MINMIAQMFKVLMLWFIRNKCSGMKFLKKVCMCFLFEYCCHVTYYRKAVTMHIFMWINKSTLCPVSQPALGVIEPFHLSSSCNNVIFNLHLWAASKFENLFLCLLPVWIFSSVNCLFMLFTLFLLEFFDNLF